MVRSYLRILMLGLVILSSMYQSINYLIETRELGSLEEDPVTVWESKFSKLKKALPAEVDTVGYIADWDVPGIRYGNGDQHGEYVLVQYVLSPVIAVRGREYEWTIGNLSPEAYENWWSGRQGDYEVTFFKNNLYLIHKIRP
jgi:hypothetical protein